MCLLLLIFALVASVAALDRRCDVNETALTLNTNSPSCYSSLGACDAQLTWVSIPAFPMLTSWVNCTDCFRITEESNRQVCIPGVEFPCTDAEQIARCGSKSSNCYRTLLKNGTSVYNATCEYNSTGIIGSVRRCTERETLTACSSDRSKCRVRCSDPAFQTGCLLEYICPFSNSTFVTSNKFNGWENCTNAESNQKCPQALRSGGCLKRGCSYSDYFNVTNCDDYIVSTCEPQNCTTAQQLSICGARTHLCQLSCTQNSCVNTKNCSHSTSLEVRRCNWDELMTTCTSEFDNCRAVMSPVGSTLYLEAYCNASRGWSSFMSNGTLYPAGKTYCGQDYNATRDPSYWNANATVACEFRPQLSGNLNNCYLTQPCVFNDTTLAEQSVATGGFYNARCRKNGNSVICFDTSWWKTTSPHRLCTPVELATTCARIRTDCRKVCTDTDFTQSCQLQFICDATPAQSFWTSAQYSSSRTCTESEANSTCATVSTDCKYETNTGRLYAYCPWSSRSYWESNFTNPSYIDCSPSESISICGAAQYNHTCAKWNCSYSWATGYANCTNVSTSCNTSKCTAAESLSYCGYYTHECTKWCPRPGTCYATSCGFPSSNSLVDKCTESQYQTSCARNRSLCRTVGSTVQSVSPFSLWWNSSCVSFTGEGTCNTSQSSRFCGSAWNSDQGAVACTTGSCAYSNNVTGFLCESAKNKTCVCPSSYPVGDLPCASTWGLASCVAGDYNLDPVNYCGTYGTSCLLNCTGPVSQYNCDAIVSGGQTCTCSNQTRYSWFNNLQCNAIKKSCNHYGFYACGKFAEYCDLFVADETSEYTASFNGNILCSCLGGTHGGVNACNSTARSTRKCNSSETLLNCGQYGTNCTYDNATNTFFPGSCECNSTTSFLFNRTCLAKPNTFRPCTKAENDTCTISVEGGCNAICSADDNCQINRTTCYYSRAEYIDCPLNMTLRYCGSVASTRSCKMWAYWDNVLGQYDYSYNLTSLTCNCSSTGFDPDFEESWRSILPTLYDRPCVSQADINLNCHTNYTQQLCGSYSGPTDPSIDAFTENQYVCKRNIYTGALIPLTCPSTFTTRACTSEEFYSYCPLSEHLTCTMACSGSNCRLYGQCSVLRACRVEEIASFCGDFATGCQAIDAISTTLSPGSCTYLCPTYRTGSSCETSTLFPGSCAASTAELCGPTNQTQSCVFDGLSARPSCTCASGFGAPSNVITGSVGSPGGLPCSAGTYACVGAEIAQYAGDYATACTLMCLPWKERCRVLSATCLPNGLTKYDPLVPLDSYKRNPAAFWPVVDLPCGQTWRIVNSSNSTSFCGQYSVSVVVNETLNVNGTVVSRVMIDGTCVCRSGWKIGLTGVCNNQFDTLPCTDTQEDYLNFIGYCPFSDQCKVQCANGTCFSYAPNRCFDTTYLMPCSFSFKNSTCGYTATSCVTNCSASRTIPPTLTCDDDNQQCTCTNREGWNKYCYDIVEVTDLVEAKTRCGPGAIGMRKRCYNANCTDVENHECDCVPPFSTNTTANPKHCGYVFAGDACDITSIASGAPDVLYGVAGFAACGLFTESSYRVCQNSSGFGCTTTCICRENTGDLAGVPCFGYDRPGNSWECNEGCPVQPVVSCSVRASYDNLLYAVIPSTCVVSPLNNGFLPDGITPKVVCSDAVKLAHCGPIAGVSSCYMYMVNSSFISGSCVCNSAVSQTDTQNRFGYPCVPWFEQYRDCTSEELALCGTKYVASCRMKHVFTPVDQSVAFTARTGNEPAYRYTTNSAYLTSKYYQECQCESYFNGLAQSAWSSSFQPADVLWPNLRWVPKCDHQAFLNLQVSVYGSCQTNSFTASLSQKACNGRGSCSSTLDNACLATTQGATRYNAMYSMIRGSFENPNSWPGIHSWQNEKNEWQFQCPFNTGDCTFASPGSSGCSSSTCNGCFNTVTYVNASFTSGSCPSDNPCPCANQFADFFHSQTWSCSKNAGITTTNCWFNLEKPVAIFMDSGTNWAVSSWKGANIGWKWITTKLRHSFMDLVVASHIVSNWTSPSFSREIKGIGSILSSANTECVLTRHANRSITASGNCNGVSNWAMYFTSGLPLAQSRRLTTNSTYSSEYSPAGTQSQFLYYKEWVDFVRGWKASSAFPGQGTDTFAYNSLPCGANTCSTCNSIFSGADCGVRNCAQPTWTSASVYSNGSSCHMYFVGTGCDNNGQRCSLLTGSYTGFLWTGRQGCVNGVYDIYGGTGRCICDVGWSDTFKGVAWRWNPIPNLATGVITTSQSACTKSKCSIACQNGGTCYDWGPDLAGLCTCPAPYTGYRCDYTCPPAAGNGLVCSGHGYCTVDSACVNAVNSLVFGGNLTTVGNYQCSVCKCYNDTNYYWTGGDCSVPVMKQTCLNGGVVSLYEGFANSSMVACSCPPEWTGLRCELSTCPIINGQVCNGKGICVAGKCRQLINSLYQCAIDTTYTGCGCEYDTKSYCQQPQTSRICNGELITDQYTGRQRAACNFVYNGAITTMACQCPPSRTGAYCQFSTCNPPENPCNGQRCYYDYETETSKCDCGLFGTTTDSRLRIGDLCQYDVTDECGFNNGQVTLCAGGGTCTNTTGEFACSCYEGNTGTKCEIQDCEVPCVWGTCRRIPNTFDSQCNCFNDNVYSKNLQLGIKSCTYSQCGNALPTADGTACRCNDTSKVPKACTVDVCPSAGDSLCGIAPVFDTPFGFVGDTVYKQCVNGMCICGWPYSQATNTSVCVSLCSVNNSVSATYKVISVGGRARLALNACVCKPGFTSSTNCFGPFCQNNGTFLNNGTCECTSYVYGGADCSSSRCVHGSVNATLNGCTCSSGWEGLLCDIEIPETPPEPESDSCSNGGTGSVPNCECSLPWIFNSETGDCTDNSCGPNGSPLTDTCTCTSPYQLNGILLRCELPCSIHGVFQVQSQLCSCDPNYEGLYCERFVPDVVNNDTEPTSPPVSPPSSAPVVANTTSSGEIINGLANVWFWVLFPGVGTLLVVTALYFYKKHLAVKKHSAVNKNRHGHGHKTDGKHASDKKDKLLKKVEDKKTKRRKKGKEKKPADKKKNHHGHKIKQKHKHVLV